MLNMPMPFQKKYLVNLKKDLHSKRMIEQAETTEELLKLMRKPLSGGNRSRLRGKLLKYEIVMMPCIKEKNYEKRAGYLYRKYSLFFLAL